MENNELENSEDKNKKFKKNLYKNKEWMEFSKKTIEKLGSKCSRCYRNSEECTLQVHHLLYETGKLPWQSPLDDLEILCSGCHAREHGILEPDRDWVLLSVDYGFHTCERQTSKDTQCGRSISYLHNTYHPQVGYRVVGSKCIQHLTKKDKSISKKVIEAYTTLSNKFESIKDVEKLPKSGWSIMKKYKKGSIRFRSRKCNITHRHDILAFIYKNEKYSSLSLFINNEKVIFKNTYSNRISDYLYGDAFTLRKIVLLSDLIHKNKINERKEVADYYRQELKSLLSTINYQMNIKKVATKVATKEVQK